MSLYVTVPISTEVIELNPDCAFNTACEDGVLVIRVDTRCQNVHQRLGLSTKTRLHWGKDNRFEAQELSAMAWPIRYRVLTRDGYYLKDGERVHFTTWANGLDARRSASEVLMRAGVLLFVVAGIGYRRVSWLLAQLFLVQVSKSALHRWVEAIAQSLPSADEILKALNEQLPIREGHLDELFPRGSQACVLVLKDEHGRLLASDGGSEEARRGERQAISGALQEARTPIRCFLHRWLQGLLQRHSLGLRGSGSHRVTTISISCRTPGVSSGHGRSSAAGSLRLEASRPARLGIRRNWRLWLRASGTIATSCSRLKSA